MIVILTEAYITDCTSPNKLREEGAVILDEQRRNHHKESLGMRLIKPYD